MRNTLFAMFLLVAGPLLADSGKDPYTPTKLEWVLVQMQARNPLPPLNASGVWMEFHPIEPNTINVLITGLSGVQNSEVRKRMEFLAQNQKNIAAKIAKDHGWAWLKVVVTPMD